MTNIDTLLKSAEDSLRKLTGSDRLILRRVSRRRSVSGRSVISLEVLWAPWSLKKARSRLGYNFLSEMEVSLSDSLKSGVVIYWFPVSKTKLYHDDFFPRARLLPPEPPKPTPRVRIKLETTPEPPKVVLAKVETRPAPKKPIMKRVRLA